MTSKFCYIESNQSVINQEFYKVESTRHIGEYIRQKLKEEGRTISWLADQMSMTRQNLSGHYLNKSEIVPSQVKKFQEVLGADFFNEFEGKLSNSSGDGETPSSKEVFPIYQSPRSGYKVTIEIDPMNFDPQKLDSLSTNLRNALENFQRELDKDSN